MHVFNIKERMTQALTDYPDINAVLVRHHGLYVWAKKWEDAKLTSESIQYLCQMAFKMKCAGIEFRTI